MDVELYAYQTIGATWLASRTHALLADQMGLGKSCQAITASNDLPSRSGFRALVLCRAVSRANWRNEFIKFSKTKRQIEVIYSGGDKPTFSQNSVTICSYEGLAHTMRSAPADLVFDLVIVDESHYLKNPLAKRTKEVLGKNGIISKTKRMYLLTGTPCPNNAAELWTTLFTFGATKLSYDQFTDKFCDVLDTGYGRRIVGSKTDSGTLKELHTLTGQVMLRRTHKDANLELPPINFSTVTVSPTLVNLYEHWGVWANYVMPIDRTVELMAIIEKELGIVEGIIKQFPGDDPKMSHQLMERLKAESASISTLRRYMALQKLQATADMIRSELKEGAYEKIVIFGVHQAAISGMQNRLRDFGAKTIFGGTKPESVTKHINNFQNPKTRHRVLVCNIMAAGTSINLTAANQVVFIEQSWTPGDNLQAAARCHRIGQEKPVFVRFIELENSLDQRITRLLTRKTAEIAKVLQDGGPRETIKTKSEIEELF